MILCPELPRHDICHVFDYTTENLKQNSFFPKHKIELTKNKAS